VKIPTPAAKNTRRGDVDSCGPAYKGFMADVAFVLTIIVFFGLAALFVRFCDHVIGADEEALPPAAVSSESEQLAA
jgi:hypothetical protein